MYLFIDEYDHFTNTILAEPDCLNSYQAETHGTGYLRKFFDTIKSATDSTLERVFVTGVSPVTMDDLTSGFNIGTNYSLAYEFNEMTGFTEEEVASAQSAGWQLIDLGPRTLRVETAALVLASWAALSGTALPARPR